MKVKLYAIQCVNWNVSLLLNRKPLAARWWVMHHGDYPLTWWRGPRIMGGIFSLLSLLLCSAALLLLRGLRCLFRNPVVVHVHCLTYCCAEYPAPEDVFIESHASKIGLFAIVAHLKVNNSALFMIWYSAVYQRSHTLCSALPSFSLRFMSLEQSPSIRIDSACSARHLYSSASCFYQPLIQLRQTTPASAIAS